jgi:hypothetical protein
MGKQMGIHDFEQMHQLNSWMHEEYLDEWTYQYVLKEEKRHQCMENCIETILKLLFGPLLYDAMKNSESLNTRRTFATIKSHFKNIVNINTLPPLIGEDEYMNNYFFWNM